jgi:hypothetical protein
MSLLSQIYNVLYSILYINAMLNVNWIHQALPWQHLMYVQVKELVTTLLSAQIGSLQFTILIHKGEINVSWRGLSLRIHVWLLTRSKGYTDYGGLRDVLYLLVYHTQFCVCQHDQYIVTSGVPGVSKVLSDTHSNKYLTHT